MARALAARLNGQKVSFKARSGEGDRLYGSITSSDIAEALSQSTGIAVDRRTIELEQPIKSLGEHQILLKMGAGITANVTAIVERDA